MEEGRVEVRGGKGDAYWKALETKYQELRKSGCEGSEADVRVRMEGLKNLLAHVKGQKLDPDDSELRELELRLFEISLVSTCNMGLAEYLQFTSELRSVLKEQSQHWDMNSDSARVALYRLLYGSRS